VAPPPPFNIFFLEMSGSFQFHFNLAGAAAPIADQPALPAKRKIAAAAAAEDEGDDAIEVQEGGLEEAHAAEIVEPAARQSPPVARSQASWDKISGDPRFTNWIQKGKGDLAVYLTLDKITCKCCRTQITVSGQTANALRHLESKGHKDKVKLEAERSARAAAGAAALQATLVKGREADVRTVARELRVSLVAHFSAAGLLPGTTSKLFSPDIVQALMFASTFAGGSSGTTIRDDLREAAAHVRGVLKKQMADKFGVIAIDGAGSKIQGGVGVSTVVFISPELPKAVLLDLSTSKRGDRSNAEYYVRKIHDAAAQYEINIGTNVVGVIGDNVTLNDKVAALLGLPRAHCIPHTIALIVHALIEGLGLLPFLTSLHTIFTAGGNTSRRTAAGAPQYVALGMKVTAMTSLYLNRWNTALQLVDALVADEAAMLLRALPAFMDDPIMQEYKKINAPIDEPAVVEDGSDDDDDDDNDVVEVAPDAVAADAGAAAVAVEIPAKKARAQRKRSNALSVIQDSLSDPRLVPKVVLLQLMTAGLADLTTQAAADGDNLPRHVISNALNIQSTLVIWESDDAIKDELRKVNFLNLTADDLTALEQLGVKAAGAALTKTRHIEEWSHILERKLLYDPRNVPAKCGSAKPHDFGLADRKPPTMALIGEWNRYCDFMYRMPEVDRISLRPSLFWRANSERFPNLWKPALWWSSHQTSAVAAERVYGVMRNVEKAECLSMSERTWEDRIFLRYNGWAVDRMFQETLDAVPFVPKLTWDKKST
jgi:hypothetical protein